MAQSRFSSPTSFNSSPLVRLLASLDVGPGSDSTQTFAEKLSDWVAWTDAISLSRVLADGRHGPVPDARSGNTAGARVVIDLVRRVRKELADGIANDTTLRGETLLRVHVAGGAPAADKVDFAAYRRNYRAHQHTMQDRIMELRAQVRAAVSQLDPALGSLAALDAVFDEALSGHQRRLLENVPALLEKRLQVLHQMPRETPANQLELHAAVPSRLPVAIGQTLQRALLAELEIRLQPVEGMIDALGMKPMDSA